jgi:putative transposase
MPRMARVVVPDIPHHVVQRGVRRMRVFFSDLDKMKYLKILKTQSLKFGVKIWSYCLMDNHVHLMVVPKSKESLAQAIGETHKRYTRMVNLRKEWKGYLWQGRFHSCPMDERHTFAAVRYVEQNPIRAGIVKKAEDYQWSSAPTHVHKTANPILSDFFLTEEIQNWSEYLQIQPDSEEINQKLERHLQTGRPLGGDIFVQQLETLLDRKLKKMKPGRKSD